MGISFSGGFSLCYERSDDIILKVRTHKELQDNDSKAIDRNEEEKIDSTLSNSLTSTKDSFLFAYTSNQIDSNSSTPKSFISRQLQLVRTGEENYELKDLVVKGDVENLIEFNHSRGDNEDKINTLKYLRFDFKNYTGPHVAVIKGNLPMLKYLIEIIGCDSNALDINNNNCINIAYQHRNIQIIEYLVSLQLQPYYELEQFLCSTPTSLGSRYVSEDGDENQENNGIDERSRSNSCDSTEFRTPYMTNNSDKLPFSHYL